MHDFLIFIAFIAIWVALTRFVLPRMGVPT
jgi:hypothetical protein